MNAPPSQDAKGAQALPAWPDAWYVVARSVDLRPGRIVDGQIAQRPFVMFRDTTGAVLALDAHCPHMGTHLRTGQVEGDTIRCALHHWRIGREGVLAGSSSCDRLGGKVWPAFERFGLVFLYGSAANPPPRPFTDLPDDYAWITATPLLLKADWRAVLVNGFDMEHLRAVHQRSLTGPLEFSDLADGGLRMRYQTEILPGGGWSSWLMRMLSRGRPRIAQTCHGPTMLVESSVGRFEARAVFGLLAQGDDTLAYAAFGARKGALLGGLRLRLIRALYTAFLRKDFSVVEGMRLRVDGVTDPGVQRIAHYLRSLPELGGHNRGD